MNSESFDHPEGLQAKLNELEPTKRLAGLQPEARRPDPVFTYVMTGLVQQLGVQLLNVKLPQTLVADLIVSVPTERMAELLNTLIDFFRRFNIIEFKGERDTFDEVEFVKNLIRAYLFFVENSEAAFENMLNVIITSRWPESFFAYMSARGFDFQPDPGRDWLRRCRVGLQEVVVVICNMLPIEPKYAEWLLFTPTDQPKWREAVRMFAQQRNWRLLDMARGLDARRYEAMTPELREIYRTYGSEDIERFRRERREAYKIGMPDLQQDDPEGLQEILNELDPAKRLVGLKPEERLVGLKPEERLAGLQPEERLAGLQPEERLVGLKPEERLVGLKPEERLAGLQPEERLAGLQPEERQKLLKLLLVQTQEEENKFPNI